MLIKTYFSQKSTSCRGGSLAQPDKLDPLLRAEKEIKKFIAQSKYLHQFLLKAGIICPFVLQLSFSLSSVRVVRRRFRYKKSVQIISPRPYKKQ